MMQQDIEAEKLVVQTVNASNNHSTYQVPLNGVEKYEQFKAETRKVGRLSLEFAFLWFCSNYFYNSGLSSTSVASSSVLCNTSSIFVYAFGLIILPEIKLDFINIISVFLSFGGIVCVTMADSQ